MKLSLKSIGSTLGVSESHLGRLFCQRTGTTFRDYLRAVRMLKAITLLKSSSQLVKLV